MHDLRVSEGKHLTTPEVQPWQKVLEEQGKCSQIVRSKDIFKLIHHLENASLFTVRSHIAVDVPRNKRFLHPQAPVREVLTTRSAWRNTFIYEETEARLPEAPQLTTAEPARQDDSRTASRRGNFCEA